MEMRDREVALIDSLSVGTLTKLEPQYTMHLDFFNCSGKDFLVCADWINGFLRVEKMAHNSCP